MKKPISNPIDPSAETAVAVGVDRSQEVLQAMEKEPSDQLTCIHVYDDYYRCNWWAPGIAAARSESLFEGLEVSTYRVRKSRFLKAAMSNGKLVVEDATKRSSLED